MKSLIFTLCVLIAALILFSCKAPEKTITSVIECCPDKYYYQNTSVLPEYTFAKEVVIGEDVIPTGFLGSVPKGPVTIGDGQFKYFSAANLIEIQPGSELSTSEYVVIGECDKDFAKKYHPTINPVSIPNVMTPNGDGLNDNFTVNVNSATYVVLEIYQRQDGTMKRIYRVERDINSNHANLWDGIQGVDFNAGSNTLSFLYDMVFMNCKEVDIHRTGTITTFR